MMRTRRLATALAAATLAFGATGCVGPLRESGGGVHTIRVLSEPPGATVLADGRELGTTPLVIRPGEVFPARFVGREYRYAGTLALRRPGCRPWSVQVDDAVLARDVVARLECGPGAAVPASVREKPTVSAGDPVAERLRRARRLHEEGLITDEEYRALRRRILESL